MQNNLEKGRVYMKGNFKSPWVGVVDQPGCLFINIAVVTPCRVTSCGKALNVHGENNDMNK